MLGFGHKFVNDVSWLLGELACKSSHYDKLKFEVSSLKISNRLNKTYSKMRIDLSKDASQKLCEYKVYYVDEQE